MLDTIAANKVTTLCAPPTVWRMLIQEDLKSIPHSLREVLGAGEPLNPEVNRRWEKHWFTSIESASDLREALAIDIFFNAGNAVIVGIGETEHMSAERPIGVDALVFRHETDAGQAKTEDRLLLFRRELPPSGADRPPGHDGKVDAPFENGTFIYPKSLAILGVV